MRVLDAKRTSGSVRGGLIAAVILLACAGLLSAQTETGQINGAVVDPTGAAVPGATVTVKSTATGSERTAIASDSGFYTVTNLLPSEYTVTAQAPGFSTARQRAVLTVGGKITVDLRLELGQTTSVVEVSTSAVQVNVDSQTLTTVVSESELRELPTLTRNPYALVAISGNVSDAGAGMRGTGFSINGQRQASTNVLLDGAANNDEFTASVGQAVPLDSIQEFSILTSNFTAEFGRASGGIVNVVTKTGSNSIHGTAYEFNRVSSLSSNSFDNNANGIGKSVFTRNQFGYSVGGPVKRDRLFFFSSTEWIRVRSNAIQTALIPTSDFLALTAANTQDFFNAYGALKPSASVIQTYSKNGLEAAGSPLCGGTSPLCGALNPDLPVFAKVSYNTPSDAGGGSPQNQYQTVARVDYNLSDKTQMYGRYALQSINFFNGTISSSPYRGFDSGENDFNNNFLFSIIRTISPRLVSQSKVVFNRLTLNQPLADYPPVPTLYVNPTGSRALAGTSILFPGYNPATPGSGIPFGGPQNFAQAYEDLSYTRGRHSFRFGGSYVYIRDNRTFGAYETAGEYLSSGAVGPAIDNMLSGGLYQFQAAIYPQGKFPGDTVSLPIGPPNFSRSNRYQEFAFYGQDALKVTPRLTLNLGLRYEYFGVQHNKDQSLDSNFYPAGGKLTPEGIANGQVMLTKNSPVGGFWKPDRNNFAPRVGFAWDIFGDGKTSFRGGYGIGYERNFGNVTFNAIQNPPNYQTVSVTNAQLPISISTSNYGPLSGTTGSIKLPRASLRAPYPYLDTAYAHTWSASIERQFTGKILAGIDYTGSKGVGLYDIAVLNRAGYGNIYLGIPCSADAGDCVATLNPQYSGVNARGGNGFSNYNAMNLKLQIRALAGLQLTSNYTWAHAIDNLSSTFSDADALNNNNGQFTTGYLDPFNPRLDKGSSDFDVKQRFVMAANWQTPAFKSGHGLGYQVLGGWSVAPILTIRTGSPYSIYDCTNAYTFCSRAAFTSAIPVNGNANPPDGGAPNTFNFVPLSNVDNYINPTYLWSDLPPFPGNMTGRNTFRGPGFWNLDFAVHKSFKFTERVSLQLRGEAFNVFNHANLYVIGSAADVSSTQFIPACRGCTGTTQDRRNLQLAAKIIF